MKKSVKWLIACIIVIVGLVIVYSIANRAPSAQLSVDEQVTQILTSSQCLSCHSENPPLPFYGSWPVVGKMVQKDVDLGYIREDMQPVMTAIAQGKSVSEVSLAKIEKVIKDGTMPMPKFYLIHWGSTITSKKKDILLSWISDQRKTNYANGLLCPELEDCALFPIPDSIPYDRLKADLGNKLFHDTRLSKDNTISCASCHGLNTGGVDNKQYSVGVASQVGGVNAPTVYNAAFNFVQFWDGRAETLAAQAAGPPLNPIEMSCESFDEIIVKLNADKAFATAFTAVYPDGITQNNITDAIQEFEKTLITPNSRFDKYLKGDKSALNTDETEGYKLFVDNSCATCHVGVNLGGKSYEYLGQANDYFASRTLPLTEEDNGRFKQTKIDRDRHRFKVPGLRNIALTAPYFHDGTQQNLRDAVSQMAKLQNNITMTDGELDKVVAFLNTLTGEYGGKVLTNENIK